MKIIENFDVSVEKEELILMLGGDLSNSERALKIINVNLDAYNEGLDLVKPKAIYDVIEIDRIEGNRLYLDSQEYFESKLIPLLMSGTKYLAICVVTVGMDLENRVEEYMQQGKQVKGLILDGVGTVVLEKVGLQIREILKEEAVMRNLDFSAALSPGQVGWDVEDQSKIFKRLDAERIGVKLRPSSLMVPRKSMSLAMGIGEGVRHDKKSCDFCHLKNSCPSRMLYDYQEQKNA